MKTEHNHERELDRHFRALQEQLPDEGFTKRVMNQLPASAPFISKQQLLLSVLMLILSVVVPAAIYFLPPIQLALDAASIVFYLMMGAGLVLVLIEALDSEVELI